MLNEKFPNQCFEIFNFNTTIDNNEESLNKTNSLRYLGIKTQKYNKIIIYK